MLISMAAPRDGTSRSQGDAGMLCVSHACTRSTPQCHPPTLCTPQGQTAYAQPHCTFTLSTSTKGPPSLSAHSPNPTRALLKALPAHPWIVSQELHFVLQGFPCKPHLQKPESPKPRGTALPSAQCKQVVRSFGVSTQLCVVAIPKCQSLP